MKYVSSASDNMTLGASIESVFIAMGDSVIKVLEKHNLAEIDPQAWYPQQDYLNVYNDLESNDHDIMMELVGIGMGILDHAEFPPSITTVEAALQSMDAYYHLNNRDKKGGWSVTINGKTAICTSRTPFPADLEYGILFAMVRRFVGKGQKFSVSYQNIAMRKANKGAINPCVFVVTWE